MLSREAGAAAGAGVSSLCEAAVSTHLRCNHVFLPVRLTPRDFIPKGAISEYLMCTLSKNALKMISNSNLRDRIWYSGCGDHIHTTTVTSCVSYE